MTWTLLYLYSHGGDNFGDFAEEAKGLPIEVRLLDHLIIQINCNTAVHPKFGKKADYVDSDWLCFVITVFASS